MCNVESLPHDIMTELTSNLPLESIISTQESHNGQIYLKKKSKVCRQVRESFTDKFSHNT
jgi:hypothetical protein